MPRLHLLEIAEQPWCPAVIRDGLTDYLQFVTDQTRPYAPAAERLAELVRHAEGSAHAGQVVDLGAGAGGPWHALTASLAASGAPVRVRLTDRFPNHAAFARMARETGGAVSGDDRAISADAVPGDLVGVRTIFSAFHHFRPEQARRVLADAVAAGAPIAVFEATKRDARTVLLTLLTPLLVVLMTPRIRPFRWSRLVFTYLLPLIPLTVLVDGIVSCLRTYTPDELRALAASVSSEYAWTAGTAGSGPVPVTFLLGRPPGTRPG